MFVIAITGHSGAGKTTLIGELVKLLGDATSLGIDNYASSSIYPPVDQWLADGANPNQFQIPQFAADVRKLYNGESILHPETKESIRPTRFLVLEEPFGRGHAALLGLIHFVVLLDVPLEIAHARKILRKNDFLPWENDPMVFMTHLREHLNWYIRSGRDFYVAVNKTVRQDYDLIVDGTKPTSEIADEIFTAIIKQINNNRTYRLSQT